MKTAKVTERAAIARINRRLAKEGQQLKTCREGSRTYLDFGRYYIADSYAIVAHHIDLKELATELKILKPYEEIEF